MSSSYRVVRLLRNHLYPTYQLHAYMASKKTSPQNGLRLAALFTMNWIRLRLGEHAPEPFTHIPDPVDYLDCDDSCLFSTHINEGYVIDIVSLPEHGMWTMQVTEPDLGSDPGNDEQARPPVPGRVIETNVAYKVTGQSLECGFKTVVSDPERTREQAEVYRLAIIRQLIRHPDFGLKQIVPIQHEFERIVSVDQINTCRNLLKNEEAHLPLVVFSQIKAEAPVPSLDALTPSAFRPMTSIPFRLPEVQNRSVVFSDPPYDLLTFAKYGVSLCRTYLLDETVRERFNRDLKCDIHPGDIAVLEPCTFGAGVRIYPYKPSKSRQDETMVALQAEMYQYPRNKDISFGKLYFLSAARESLLRLTAESTTEAATLSSQWAQKVKLLESKWNALFQSQEDEKARLSEQVSRQKKYAEQLELEKQSQRDEFVETLKRSRLELAARDAEISYLKRKISQPKNHNEIAVWVEKTFTNRLILHPRAVGLLNEKSARNVDIELICNALDFLATDYWDRRYAHITTEEMLTRCSQKYGRPFEVKPTGNATIEFTPSEYKIKYFIDPSGNEVDSSLEYHLRVGNDPENLLRIYFLHDDTKKLIVVGSLPRHLRAVTIK